MRLFLYTLLAVIGSLSCFTQVLAAHVFTDVGGTEWVCPEVQADTGGEGEIQLFPNPASDFVQISLDRARAKIRIHSLLGQIETEQIVMDNDKIYLGNLKNGLYIVRIFSLEDGKLLRTVRLTKK